MHILSDLASVIALAISIAAFLQSRTLARRAERPIIRVVAAFTPRVGVIGRGATGIGPTELDIRTVILKNVGRGPGMTVIAFDPEDAALMGSVDVVEPLGDGETETARIGRVTLYLTRPIATDRTYALYYLDTLGGWHVTRFQTKGEKIECAFLGEVKRAPVEVEAQRTVAVG